MNNNDVNSFIYVRRGRVVLQKTLLLTIRLPAQWHRNRYAIVCSTFHSSEWLF